MDLKYIQEVKPNPKVPELFPGDTVKVVAQVKEGERARSQTYQGVVIKKGGDGPSQSFTVRRISYGIGVERTFLIFSPLLESVEVIRRGSVRRSKLFYLRGLSARESRIKEKGRRTKELIVGAGSDRGAEGLPAPAETKPAK